MHDRPTDFKVDAFKFFTGGGEGGVEVGVKRYYENSDNYACAY